ncbi:MAG: Hvo_1808 family surface protein [Halobacteria archaeon]
MNTHRKTKIFGYVLFFVLVALCLAASSVSAAENRGTAKNSTVGYEDGFWYDSKINIDEPLNDSEVRDVVSRAMARVEYIRDRNFKEDVNVVKKNRSELNISNQPRENGSVNRSDAAKWNNQVWEALFMVGENKNVNELIGSTAESAVGGFYSRQNGSKNGSGPMGSEGNITVVTEEGGLNELTVGHELVHALQDQYYNLSADRFNPPVQDEQLGNSGLLEGEANYVQRKYSARCKEDWSCVDSSGAAGGGGTKERDVNRAVLLIMFQPYSDGPPYIAWVRGYGGWEAVNHKFRDNVPKTSKQVIHRINFTRPNMSFTDSSAENWSTWPDEGIDGYDIGGEASVYMMFWQQTRTTGREIINEVRFQNGEAGELDRLNYVSRPSEGWLNDRIYPYHNGERRGYVWKTLWNTTRDAKEFHSSYMKILEGHDAEKVEPGVWKIESGKFADAFRVLRDGRSVVVTNAPTVEELDQIRSIEEGEREVPKNVTNGSFEGSETENDSEQRELDGFGLAVAVLGVIAAVLVAKSAVKES